MINQTWQENKENDTEEDWGLPEDKVWEDWIRKWADWPVPSDQSYENSLYARIVNGVFSSDQ